MSKEPLPLYIEDEHSSMIRSVTTQEDSSPVISKEHAKLNDYEVVLRNGRVIPFSAFGYEQRGGKFFFLEDKKAETQESFVVVSEVSAIRRL